MGWMDAPEVTPTGKWAEAPEAEAPMYAPNGVPMNAAAKAEVIAKAKMGFGGDASPRQAGIDDQVNKDIVDRGMLHAIVQGGAQGGTFGFGDEIVAGGLSLLPGWTYDEALKGARGELDAARMTRPKTTTTAEIATALAVPLGAAKSTGKLGLDVLKGAATGGGLSALYGFGSGEGGLGNRATNAAVSGTIGALTGGLIPVAGAGIEKLMQGRANSSAIKAATKSAPTTEELRAAGNAAYKAVDDAGVVVKPEAFAGMADDVTSAMRRGGLDEGAGSLTPQSARLAGILEDTATTPNRAGVPFSEIDLMRRKAGVPASNLGTPLESKLGSQAIDGMDNFINKLTPDQVASGDAAALPALIGKARETWARMSKSQKIDDAIENSRNYLSGEASGIRNQFAAILKNPKTARGFSELEKEAMRKVINGSVPEKILNLMGGGLGQMATMGMGAGMGGIPGFLLGAGVATGARKGSEALANKNAEIVRALVASGKAGAVPQISGTPRKIIEQLMQRGTAAGLQQ